MYRLYSPAALVLFLSSLLTTITAHGDDEVFEVSEISNEGRVVSAGFADFDGDGRKDLMIASLNGMPPEETRTVRVHLQNPDG